jgi:cytochrome P450
MRVMAQWNGNSLLIAEGAEWLRKRRLVQPTLQPKRLGDYLPAISNEVDKQCRSWQTLLEQAGGSTTLDVQGEMNSLTLNVISMTMFGTDLSAEAQVLGQAVAVLSGMAVEEMSTPFTLPRWIPTARNRRKNAAIAAIDRVVRRMIQEQAGTATPGSHLLSSLLTHTETDPDGTKHQLSREEIRDEVTTMLLAGHDTTAAALTWTLYFLATNLSLQQQLHDEIADILSDRAPTMDDFAHMKLMDRVVKESLRLRPPAIGVFFREAMEDVEIGGWLLSKGSLAGTYSWVVHRDPRWFPNPDKFDPDRFLPERFAELPLGAYFPFGAGPRMCIGQGMALLEIQTALSAMLRRFELSVPSGHEPRPRGLLSLRPEGGMPLTLRVRRK